MEKYFQLFVLIAIVGVAFDADATSLDTKNLVEVGSRHSLPLPSKEARLVLAHTGSWGVLGSQSTSRDPGIYSPAYLLEERSDGSVLVLRGTETHLIPPRHNRRPPWRPFSTKVVEPKPDGHISSFSRLSAFVCAVQTAALGDEATAQAIWDRFSRAPMWSEARYGEDIQGQLRNPEMLLARCIFDHLRDALLQKQADREDIHTRMDALLSEFSRLDRDWRRQIFNDLTITVDAKPAKPGSIEALLLDWADRPSDMRHLGIFHDYGPNEADASAREIVMRGYNAVPELLALLDDPRITLHEIPACMKAPPRIKRVGELARGLISMIAGGHSDFPEDTDSLEAIRAWWKGVRHLDEPDFLSDALFTDEGKTITAVNEGPARILGQRFPEKLGILCKRFSEHSTPDVQPWALADVLAQSRLPLETRIRLLSEFAQRGSLMQKRCILQRLAEIDDEVCSALLLPILKTLSKDVVGPYWTCPEASFTHVVNRIEDDNVWREYLRTAKRSAVGLRMEMMKSIDYCRTNEDNRQRRLAFLAAFLDDKAVRRMTDTVGKFDGPCSGFTIPRLAVRDLAAMKLVSLLDIEEFPDEFWTDVQWEGLRQKVRERLAQEELPGL